MSKQRQYIQQRHTDSISSLPLSVRTWFEVRYDLFLDDCSYRNDACPSFHIANAPDDADVLRPVVLVLSGTDGEFGELCAIEMASFDDPSDPKNSGWGRDGNEDILLHDSALDSKGNPWANGHTVDWLRMMKLVDGYLCKHHGLTGLEMPDAFKEFEDFLDSGQVGADNESKDTAEKVDILDITRSFCR